MKIVAVGHEGQCFVNKYEKRLHKHLDVEMLQLRTNNELVQHLNRMKEFDLYNVSSDRFHMNKVLVFRGVRHRTVIPYLFIIYKNKLSYLFISIKIQCLLFI